MTTSAGWYGAPKEDRHRVWPYFHATEVSVRFCSPVTGDLHNVLKYITDKFGYRRVCFTVDFSMYMYRCLVVTRSQVMSGR